MTTKSSFSPTLLLVDAMSLVFQAFYAVRGLTTPEGLPTGAIFGFTRKLLGILDRYNPSHIAVVFDEPGDTFRNEIYPEYKANRDAAPDDFHIQVPYVFKILDAMGIPTCSRKGFEADDLIGTLSTQASEQGCKTLIASADKDLFQLVDERVSILRTPKTDMTVYGPAEVRERMGVSPEQVVDYLAMVGDSSDNIPGIPRVGPKTAIELLGQFASLEEMLAHPDQIKNPKRRALIVDNADQARLSYRLAKIDCAVEIDHTVDTLQCAPWLDAPELLALYRELNFTAFLREAGQEGETEAAAVPKSAPTDQIETNYCTITDQEGLEGIVSRVREVGRVAVDTETTAIDPMYAVLVGISLSCEAGQAWYVPVGHAFGEGVAEQPPLDLVRAALGPLLADPAIRKVAQNAKYDMRVLARHGLPLQGLEFDTMLASYVLDPGAKHGLKAMAQRLLGVTMTEIDELIGKGNSAITMDQVEIAHAAPYACADADLTLRLADLFAGQLESEGLMPLFRDIEMPLVEVLDAMEAEGVTLDADALRVLSTELRTKIEALTRDIYEIAGHPFAIKSPKQVADVLFNEIGLKPRGKTKTGQSTRSEILEELSKDHPLPARILEFRQLDKLESTYVLTLPHKVNPNTGRIHTSFNQFIAATGRLSSSSPNLQNIPIRSELGKTIRGAFAANGPDEVLLAADYSQIELRILAHITGDEALQRAFVEGQDIHTQTAARIFDMMSELVTEEMRSQAKVINFGILYGMSAHRLSREISIPRAQAQAFIDDYFAAYPGVRKWSQALIAEARKTGYVTTLSGRRRPVPGVNDRNGNVRANAERMAVNTPIQGSAADMIKIAMIALHRDIRDTKRRARMVLQVHDELIFSLPAEDVEEFEPVVRELMEGALPLDVPVRVDVKVGRTWAEC